MQAKRPLDIDSYIASFPPDIQKKLEQVRKTIRKAAPKAGEAIKYAMPTFVQDGINLAHFAAFASHIGFYPAPTAIKSFNKELSKYKTGKGSIQFPLNEPLPLGLITSMVKWNMKQNAQNGPLKKKR